MKAKLEFDLPEESEEFKTAINASSYLAVLNGLDNYLRSKIKYPAETVTEPELMQLEAVREKLYSLLQEYEISI